MATFTTPLLPCSCGVRVFHQGHLADASFQASGVPPGFVGHRRLPLSGALLVESRRVSESLGETRRRVPVHRNGSEETKTGTGTVDDKRKNKAGSSALVYVRYASGAKRPRKTRGTSTISSSLSNWQNDRGHSMSVGKLTTRLFGENSRLLPIAVGVRHGSCFFNCFCLSIYESAQA